MRIVSGASTDTGQVRDGNEDSYLVDRRLELFAVADGMGGHRAGEIASATALDGLKLAVTEGTPVADAVGRANTAVWDKAAGDTELAGMGTTLTAAIFDEGTLTIAHVGDSRAYLLRGEQLERLTTDHSLVEELIRDGKLTEEQAAVHPQRSIITRALGVDSSVEVDVYSLVLEGGDRVILCSDGLTSMVRPAGIAEILRAEPDPTAAANALVDAANAAGGEDNITAVALRLGADEASAAAATAAAVDTSETGELDALAEPAPAETSPESTAVAVAVAPPPAAPEPAPAPVEPVLPRPVPAALPRSGETLISVPPIVTGFGSGAPVRRRGRVRRLGVFAAVVALMLCVLWAALIGLRWSHFVGVDPATGKVAVYQGIPYDLGGGVKLFTLVHVSRIPAATLPAARRKHLFDHALRSSESARSLVAKLEQTEP
jgi:protein phosphatase